MSLTKMQRCGDTDDASVHEPSSRLLRHFETLRPHLLPLLSSRDLLTLLTTCRSLQQDDELLSLAFARNETTRHLFQRCRLDACAVTPRFTYFDNVGCSRDHANDSSDYYDSSDNDDVDENWNIEALSPARRVSLLSLALLFETKLAPLIDSEDTACVHMYYAVPFILPLSRMDKIAGEEPTLPSQLACHLQNFTFPAEQDPTVVACGFCSAIEEFIKDSKAHNARRDDEKAALLQQLEEEGHCGGSAGYTDEYWDRMEAFKERKKDLDQVYGTGIKTDVNEVFAGYCADGKAPQLQLAAENGTRKALWDVLWEASHDEFWDQDGGFCPSKLQPLASFFQRHGFGSVVCSTLARGTYKTEELSGNLRHALMIGAAAPQGYFAGVYYLVQYT